MGLLKKFALRTKSLSKNRITSKQMPSYPKKTLLPVTAIFPLTPIAQIPVLSLK
jgi:hypothetical protein